MKKTELSKYNNDWYKPGNKAKQILWFFVNAILVKPSWNGFSGMKVMVLKWFGAEIGTGVVIKPKVNIKYPWKLRIGDYSWIGEDVWIDNLAEVVIGSHVCISQGAMLLCGNHNYKTVTFDLMVAPITLEQGAWICAKAVVCPGVVVKSHAILGVGAVTSKDLEAYGIYQGIPAIKVNERSIA